MVKRIVLLIAGLFALSVVWENSPKLGGLLLVCIVGGLLFAANKRGLLPA